MFFNEEFLREISDYLEVNCCVLMIFNDLLEALCNTFILQISNASLLYDIIL